jgi:hypothetical protein
LVRALLLLLVCLSELRCTVRQDRCSGCLRRWPFGSQRSSMMRYCAVTPPAPRLGRLYLAASNCRGNVVPGNDEYSRRSFAFCGRRSERLRSELSETIQHCTIDTQRYMMAGSGEGSQLSSSRGLPLRGSGGPTIIAVMGPRPPWPTGKSSGRRAGRCFSPHSHRHTSSQCSVGGNHRLDPDLHPDRAGILGRGGDDLSAAAVEVASLPVIPHLPVETPADQRRMSFRRVARGFSEEPFVFSLRRSDMAGPAAVEIDDRTGHVA